MKAIILAAGRGSRMGKLTEEQPKCMTVVKGKTLFEWQLESLRAAGIDDISVVTGYKRELLKNRGLHEFHNPRWAATNMVSSLECAEDWLDDTECVVSYSDIYYEPAAVNLLQRSSADIAITYDINWRERWEKRFENPLDDAETFRLDENGNLIEIGQRPEQIEQVQGQYMGLLRFSPAGWQEVIRIRANLAPAERDKMHMTGTLQEVINAQRIPVAALPYDGDWGEFDSPSDIDAV